MLDRISGCAVYDVERRACEDPLGLHLEPQGGWAYSRQDAADNTHQADLDRLGNEFYYICVLLVSPDVHAEAHAAYNSTIQEVMHVLRIPTRQIDCVQRVWKGVLTICRIG